MGLIIEEDMYFYFTFKKVGAFKNEFVGSGAGDGGVKLIDLQRSKLTKVIRDLIQVYVGLIIEEDTFILPSKKWVLSKMNSWVVVPVMEVLN